MADPHAVFYTDRGQAQVFYNVLAALNQADYVEPPYQKDIHQDGAFPSTEVEPPTIFADEALGDFLNTGAYHAPQPPVQRTVQFDADGVHVEPPIVDPTRGENERSNLPRLRVRAVTSDDGDVYFRERLQRRAIAEQMRVEMAILACRALFFTRGLPEHGGCDPSKYEDPVRDILAGGPP